MVNDNELKGKHGRKAQEALKNMLEFCQYLGYLTNIEENYRNGYSQFENQTQFYLPFIITFEDGTLWGLTSTTSYRSDRAKMSQWDSYHLKKILGNEVLKQSFLIYPDSVSKNELTTIQSAQKIFCPNYQMNGLDGLLSQEQLFYQIENYALNKQSNASKSAKVGNNFEKRITYILNHPMNLYRLKGINPPNVGLFYPIFEKIINSFGINPIEIKEIRATCDKKEIGFLSSGGAPKTDILVKIIMNDSSESIFTISCKRSRHKWVSVHEYKANKFAEVLDPKNDELKYLLNRFQKLGGIKAFEEENPENEAKLTKYMEQHLDKLIRWVIAGEGGTDDRKLTVSHILTYQDGTSDISIYDIDSYITLLKTKKERYGTPFRWTRNNDNIQLKMEVNLVP